jgi:hypothetical protein
MRPGGWSRRPQFGSPACGLHIDRRGGSLRAPDMGGPQVHATHQEPLTPAGAAAQTSVLALGVAVPILLLILLRRAENAPTDA